MKEQSSRDLSSLELRAKSLQRVIEYPQVAALRMRDAHFQSILIAHRLEWLWQHVVETNPARRNTYHNNEHMKTVARLSWELLNIEIVRSTCLINNPAEVLLVAGMMHDYGHSGGELTDEENIAIALMGVENIAGTLIERYNEEFVEDVKDVIRVTQYPFVYRPTNLLQQIIRDADVMQSFEPNGLTLIMEGLRNELRNDKGEVPTHAVMAEGQIKFLQNLELFTDTAKAVRESYGETIKEAFEAYVVAAPLTTLFPDV